MPLCSKNVILVPLFKAHERSVFQKTVILVPLVRAQQTEYDILLF